MSAVVQFVTAADYALDTEERLVDLVDTLVELGQRLDNLEALAVENAGADPLTEILARLDAFENRLARLETRQRRPPPFPITVIENIDFTAQRRFDDLSNGLATERYERARRDDQDLAFLPQDLILARWPIFAPRGVLHCLADGKGGQAITDTGPLTTGPNPGNVAHGRYHLDHSWADRGLHRQQNPQQDGLGPDIGPRARDGGCGRGDLPPGLLKLRLIKSA